MDWPLSLDPVVTKFMRSSPPKGSLNYGQYMVVKIGQAVVNRPFSAMMSLREKVGTKWRKYMETHVFVLSCIKGT